MDEVYYKAIKSWRSEYEKKLGSPDGWLSISGLFWLKEGENSLGSSSSSDIQLPLGTAPKEVGTFTLSGTKIKLQAAAGVTMHCNDELITTREIKLNQYGSSDWIFINELKFAVIQRGTRYGVRVYDMNNPQRRKYLNIGWFPIEESLCIQAPYHELDEPINLSIMNVLGDISEEPCSGYVEFTIDDQVCKLYPVVIEESGILWFMFKDATNTSLSYHGGRFLKADMPQDGVVTLDFNKAYNPPCAYTHFATCPLPPDLNRLPVKILAGELEFVQ
jgi:uncharacterized protein (DUF1684 family)